MTSRPATPIRSRRNKKLYVHHSQKKDHTRKMEEKNLHEGSTCLRPSPMRANYTEPNTTPTGGHLVHSIRLRTLDERLQRKTRILRCVRSPTKEQKSRHQSASTHRHRRASRLRSAQESITSKKNRAPRQSREVYLQNVFPYDVCNSREHYAPVSGSSGEGRVCTEVG